MKIKNIFLVFFLTSFILTLSVNSVLAQDVVVGESGEQIGIRFTPQIPIPGFSVDRVMGDGSTLFNYIVSIYQYGATVAGLVAMFMIVLAGWKWLMAAGNPEKISAAKDTIQGAVIGLILLFGSYLLLAQISGRLVTFTELKVAPVTKIPIGLLGLCMQGAQDKNCGSAGAFTVVYEGATTTCPGGLKCSRSDASCVIPKGGTAYERCTMEYMISRSNLGLPIDCTCVSNNLRYGSRFR